jgi:hypothetical protein
MGRRRERLDERRARRLTPRFTAGEVAEIEVAAALVGMTPNGFCAEVVLKVVRRQPVSYEAAQERQALAQVGKLPDENLEALATGQSVLRVVPKDLAAAVDLVLRLTDEQRKQLAAKTASVRFVPPGHAIAAAVPKQPQRKQPQPSADDVRERLRVVSSEDDARAYLDGLGLPAAAMKTLAKQLQVPLGAKAYVADGVDGIIKIVVRSRLTAEIIRNY